MDRIGTSRGPWRSGLAAGLGAILAGCSLPSQPVGFDAPDPQGRVLALQRAAAEDDRSAIPELIELLGSDDPAQRMLANELLERMTGQDLGFDHAAPEAERLEAIGRWEAWWVAQWQAGAVAQASGGAESPDGPGASKESGALSD